MSISANDRDDKGKATASVYGVTLRVSEDGAAVEQQTPAGWVMLPQIPDLWGKGYLRVRLRGVRKTVAVHQLVARAFHGEPPTPDHVLVEHLDGSRRRNHKDNLRWATWTDNLNSALRLGERAPKYPVKLNEALVYHLRTAHRRDELQDLAEQFDVGMQTIRDVFDGHTWRHVRREQGRLFDPFA